MHKILVINFGSTSTKIAYYVDNVQLYIETINHPSEELRAFKQFKDQVNYRKAAVDEFVQNHRLSPAEFSAVVSRGGNTEPIESGAYAVNEEMIEQQLSGKYGQHPTDLGSSVVYYYEQEYGVPSFVVDPPSTDEMNDLARVTGHPLFTRKSSFHALNQKATAKKYAYEKNTPYNELNLIVVHLGGGITISPHEKGRIIDSDNGLEGDGCFSTNRSGALPVGQLVDLCFSGDYNQAQIKRMINGEGGLMAYLGTSDVRTVEERSKEDPKYKFYLDAMIYQIVKQIGGIATVLKGEVDAIILTGGIAHSAYVVAEIKKYCSYLGAIEVYPGENEMDALALGVLDVLEGREASKVFQSQKKLETVGLE